MFVTALFFASIFCLAFPTGWFLYRAFFWNWVDLIYYPLAGIGIVLLFISGDVQREAFRLSQLLEQKDKDLALIEAARPTTSVTDFGEVLTIQLGQITSILDMVKICESPAVSANAHCLAVAKLGEPVRKFEEQTKRKFSNFEDRLLETCVAGDEMLITMRDSGALSPIIMGEFIGHYQKMAKSKLSLYDDAAIKKHIVEFGTNAAKRTDAVHEQLFGADDAKGELLREIRNEEIRIAEILLSALSQCATHTREDLGSLAKWKATTSTSQQEVARLNAQYQAVKQKTTQHKLLLWIQLNLWPLVLLAALSLKFAKGAAGLNKAYREKAKPTR